MTGAPASYLERSAARPGEEAPLTDLTKAHAGRRQPNLQKLIRTRLSRR